MTKIIFIALLVLCAASCTPVKYVNVNSRHNYYQKHRPNTYTIPVWIPNVGVVLETHVYRKPRGKSLKTTKK
jgi:hypothetical protein